MIERDPGQPQEPGEDRTRELREDDVHDRLYGAEGEELHGGGGSSEQAGREEREGGSQEGRSELVTPSGIDPKPIERRYYDLSHVPTTDLMGQDKKRPVVGQAYGPSKARQATVWLGSVAVIIALFIGGTIAVNELDNPPPEDPDTAPWRNTELPPARPL